jgi:hypothetical protein
MASVQEDAPVGRCEEALRPCEDGARSNQAWGKNTGSSAEGRWTLRLKTGVRCEAKVDWLKIRATVWIWRRPSTFDRRGMQWSLVVQLKIIAPCRQTRRSTECKVNICKVCVYVPCEVTEIPQRYLTQWEKAMANNVKWKCYELIKGARREGNGVMVQRLSFITLGRYWVPHFVFNVLYFLVFHFP